MSTTYFKRVRRRLSANCPVMNHIIKSVGPCTLTHGDEDPFTLLVRCVISQQISTRAAESISSRLIDQVGGTPIAMQKLAQLTDSQFRGCGISGPKQRTLRAVIEHIRANPRLLPAIPQLDDDAIRTNLIAIKGIGPWTVDMFLLFGLGRPDVWPVGDYGIKVAVRQQFRLRTLPDAAKLTRIARPWEPYRSIASWYLWRSLELRDDEA